MDKLLYSWKTDNFKTQVDADFLQSGVYIWVFNWHEIPHLGLSINGKYSSVSITGTQQNENVQKIWRMSEMKGIPLFLIRLQNIQIEFEELNHSFSKKIQLGETCLKPLKILLLDNQQAAETLSTLIFELESKNQIASFYANNVIQKNELSLLNYNKLDVLEMIANKMQVYEAGK